MKKGTVIICLLFLLSGVYGCGIEKEAEGETKREELDFTICKEENIPEELKQIIESKKELPFQISFSNSAFIYYVIGYGEQPSLGYSIVIDSISLYKGRVYVSSNLLGPEKTEKIEAKKSFPYIVIKLPKREEDVVFET